MPKEKAHARDSVPPLATNRLPLGHASRPFLSPVFLISTSRASSFFYHPSVDFAAGMTPRPSHALAVNGNKAQRRRGRLTGKIKNAQGLYKEESGRF